MQRFWPIQSELIPPRQYGFLLHAPLHANFGDAFGLNGNKIISLGQTDREFDWARNEIFNFRKGLKGVLVEDWPVKWLFVFGWYSLLVRSKEFEVIGVYQNKIALFSDEWLLLDDVY